MKTFKKAIVKIMIIVIFMSILSGMYNTSYAGYSLDEWSNSYIGGGKSEWNIDEGFGQSNYSMHANFACYVFDNIYCIQPGYEYNDDAFYITYGIEINGNTATLYQGNWSKEIVSWESENNNIMAGIITPASGRTTGMRESGNLKTGKVSDTQNAIYAFWDTFEAGMKTALKNANKYLSDFDTSDGKWEENGVREFGFSSGSVSNNEVVQAVKQDIANNGTSYNAKIVIMDNSKNKPSATGYRQNLIAVEPGEPSELIKTARFTVQKQWKNDTGTGMRPSQITITLYGKNNEIVTKDADGNAITNPVTLSSANADSSNANLWTYTFTNLPEEDGFIYSASESISVSGDDKTKFEAYIQENGVQLENGYKFVNRLETTEVKVTKEWSDGNAYGNMPNSITVSLYKGNTKVKEAVLNSSSWSYTFSNLPKYENGKEIEYTIKEETKTVGYLEDAKIVETSKNNFTITNELELIDIEITKAWQDSYNGTEDFDEIRPEKITVQLYENGNATNKTLEISETNNWKATFTDLPKYKNKQLVTYEVKEVDVLDGYTTSTSGNATNGFTITNTHEPHYDGYIEITGTVWMDGEGGKSNDINGVFDDGEEKLKDITVRLKYIDENGTHHLFNENLPSVYETKTDENGNYKIVVNYDNSHNVYKLYEDITTVNKKLETAYVEFEYDGMIYTTVASADSGENTSKAVENETQRNNFDAAHSTVTTETAHPDNWTDKNITAATKTISSYQRNDETRSTVVKYCSGTGTERTDSFGAWNDIITGDSCGQCSGTAHDMKTFEITVGVIPNINLGLFEREQPDVAIFSDLSKVEVTMNGQKYTYLYGVKGTDSNDVGLQAKFQNKGTYTYRRPVNPADIAYLQEEANKDAMSVLVTYEVKVANLSTTLPITVHNIINSYDSEYTLNTAGWTVTEAAGFKQATSGDLNISVEPQTESEAIELTYTVSMDAIRNLLNEEATLNNAVEIGSYSIRYGESTLYAEQRTGGRTNKPYGGYDYDSHPGNAGIFINGEGRLEAAKPEDDTDIAPSFVLCLDDPATLAGTVWEDTDANVDDEERLGNGFQDDTEEKVKNVRVEIYNSEGELATLYDENGNAKDESAAIQYTDSNGYYALEGLVTGEEYFIKYIYGNDKDDLAATDGNATTIAGNEVNARNYKSTTINGDKDPIIEQILKKETTLTAEEKMWPLTHNDGYTVAVDNMKDRLSIGELKYSTYSVGENMTAYTKPFITQLEFDYTGETEGSTDAEGNVTDKNGTQITNILDRFDFGIIERPREELIVQKTVTYFKVTLANGQVLTEGNPNDPDANITYAKTMGFKESTTVQEARNALEKRLLVEMDTELIQGAKLDVRYEVKVINNNEIDYDYGTESDYGDEYIATSDRANYYYYGESSGLTEMTSTVKFVDYLDGDLIYSEDTTKWTTTDENTLKDGGFINPNEVYDKLKEGEYKILQTAENSITLQRGIEYAFSQEMTASKLLANQDENVFDNHAEIIEIDGKTARTIKGKTEEGIQIEYIPGNYEPSEGPNESDDDKVEIIVTPPTGITNYIMTYVIVGFVGLIVIFAGVVFIKKKVLIK